MEWKPGPRFSQAAVDELRNSDDYKKWNQNFEKHRKIIDKKLSPRDIRPLVKAGADKEKLLTFLAFIVTEPRQSDSLMMDRSKKLSTLAKNLESLAAQASLLSCDPRCDGRFWMALQMELSWDLVPQCGVIEAPTIRSIRNLALLFRQRGEALGKESRMIGKHLRNRGLKDLTAYVWDSTGGKNFDSEIAYLLMAAYVAVGQRQVTFTPEKIKKFRQRHLQPDIIESLKPPVARKTLGQRIAERPSR